MKKSHEIKPKENFLIRLKNIITEFEEKKCTCQRAFNGDYESINVKLIGTSGIFVCPVHGYKKL